jgi:hypothetical protein
LATIAAIAAPVSDLSIHIQNQTPTFTMSIAKTMNLFNTLLSAIDDPAKQASTDGLSTLLGTLQQLGSGQGDPKAIQGLVGIAGKYVRTSLQDQQASGNAQAIVNQYGGTEPSEAAVAALLSVPQVEQLIQEAETRTGLDAGTVRSLLPTVIPMVLALLKMGGSKGDAPEPAAAAPAATAPSVPTGDNALLNSFLDTDGDGDLDVGDALKLASRFLR